MYVGRAGAEGMTTFDGAGGVAIVAAAGLVTTGAGAAGFSVAGTIGRTGAVAAGCCLPMMAFKTSPGLEMLDKSILVLIPSASPRAGREPLLEVDDERR